MEGLEVVQLQACGKFEVEVIRVSQLMAAPFKDNIPPAKNNKSTLETRMALEKQTILKVQKDMMLRALAQKAISEGTRDAPRETNEETEDTLKRQKIRDERRRERERE